MFSNINFKKLLTTVLAAAAGAALPALSGELASVPLAGPVLSGLAIALAHYFDAPKKA
jgi:hypothetical protein